ncbi:MAG: aromatic-ring-hydroxylating dioxygenase subunit beta [Haliea sp.]|jgi:benzoate/toluate 1,2-dioxygenase beta subunit|nr:aromatic-ring-hydroxylating dioxygenase subunit beta [Haliea sp.]
MTDIRKIEEFLYDEAALLDNPDLDRWMELFTEDGTYWMPVAEDQADPINHVSIFYDDRVMMEVRRRNYVHPRAASKDHHTRCSHVIGNVRTSGTNDHGDLVVTSNQHVLVYYRHEQRVFGTRVEHHLLPDGDSYRIRHKKVTLINCEAPQKSLTVYL